MIWTTRSWDWTAPYDPIAVKSCSASRMTVIRFYVWSGNGIRWPEVWRFGLETLVTDCFVKPMDNLAEAVEQKRVPIRPDFVIDDYQEVPAALCGVCVSPYTYNNGKDDEMEHVYRIITEYLASGYSKDRRFQARQSQRS